MLSMKTKDLVAIHFQLLEFRQQVFDHHIFEIKRFTHLSNLSDRLDSHAKFQSDEFNVGLRYQSDSIDHCKQRIEALASIMEELSKEILKLESNIRANCPYR